MKLVKQNQAGFASIIIAVTIIIVTSLIVVGFAKLANDEQDQVTDRSLSAQATYAAESGINAAAKAISEGYNKSKTSCTPLLSATGPGESFLTNNKVDGTSDTVQYSCLLIDPTPKTLDFSPVSTVTPRVFQFSGRTGANPDIPAPVTKIKFSWQDSSASKTTPSTAEGTTTGAFPAVADWSFMSMLRVSIAPLTVLSRDELRKNTFTAFLYPSTSTTNQTVNYGADIRTSGVVMNGGCSSTGIPAPGSDRLCSATIVLPGLPGPYLVTLRSIYSKANVSISINDGLDRLAGAQAKIDSTGRALDITKRIQVRIPIDNVYDYPGFSVETAGDICKDLSVTPALVSSSCY